MKTPLQCAKQFLEIKQEISPYLVGHSIDTITFQASQIKESELLELVNFFKENNAKIKTDSAHHEEMGNPNTGHYWIYCLGMSIHLGFMFRGEAESSNMKAALDIFGINLK